MMKHLALCGALAALLAALLAGCGAKTAASARPAGRRELKSTPPDSMHATAAITEQYTLEKVVQAENGGTVRLNIHLPRLESDSADAARINAEIASSTNTMCRSTQTARRRPTWPCGISALK